MINFDSNANVSTLEAQARELGQSASQSARLPTHFSGHSLGFQSALIQLLITWARRTTEPHLVTHSQTGDSADPSTINFLRTAHGLVAALLARRVTTATGDDITEEMRRAAALRYQELARIEVRGTKLWLVVADNHTYAPKAAPFVRLAAGAANERSRRKDSFIGDFRFHLRKCFGAVGATPLEDLDANRILETVYELFANTEEWGTSDVTNAPLKDSVRGILADVVPLAVIGNRISARGGEIFPALRRYLERLVSDPGIAATHLLEISVFDSGVGLAQRNLECVTDDGLSTSVEYEAVLNCLRKHGTSTADATRGMGLYEVMRMMTRLKGFLSLRTGRLGLFRDYIEDAFLLDDDWSAVVRERAFYRGFEYLWDWDVDPVKVRSSPTADTSKQQRPFLDGCLFTLWVPLRQPATQLPLFNQQ